MRSSCIVIAVFGTAGGLIVLGLVSAAPEENEGENRGADHVGVALPEFMTGGECLFCHREDVGEKWSGNRHHRMFRPVSDEPSILESLRSEAGHPGAEAEFILGNARRAHLLKRAEEYGHLAILSTAWDPHDRRWESPVEEAHWDGAAFNESCAGCHATAVESETRAFAALSLDCFVCHGDVTLDHSADPALALFSKRRPIEPGVVASVCGQCHIRSGTSRSTGAPFPNQFVPGDNLFRDFQVDWSDAALRELDPVERHILENARNIAFAKHTELTCLSCHDVHRQSARKHVDLPEQTFCNTCHVAGEPRSVTKPALESRAGHSTCRYPGREREKDRHP